MLSFRKVYLSKCILMVILISPLLVAHADDEQDSGPDLWDLTPEEATLEPLDDIESPKKPSGSHKKRVRIFNNKPVQGRLVGKGDDGQHSKTLKDSFSVLQVGHEDVNEDFVYQLKNSLHKMTICAVLDKFECKSAEPSPTLKISVFKSGSDEEIQSTHEWNCKTWNSQGRTTSQGIYSITGYGISVQLTGSWDPSSKASISFLTYFPTMDKCPVDLPFDCDACKSLDNEVHHCAAKGHLPSLMCHNSPSIIHGRAVGRSSGGGGSKKEDSESLSDGVISAIILIVLEVMKFLIVPGSAGIYILIKRRNRVLPT